MKKFLALTLALCMLFALCACGSSKTLTLNVYNWGEYISDGSEGSLDTIKAFENWYRETYGEKVKVNYTTYASNEDMYAKLASGAVSYDVIIPSDYMIARLASENMLLPLDFKIPLTGTFVEFECPECGAKIARCEKCRTFGHGYKCECGFEGP